MARLRREATAWGPAAGWILVLFALSRVTSIPSSLQPLTVVPDKAVHAILYTVLGVALAWGRRRSRLAVPHLVLVVLGSLYGAADEWHQSFVPGRSPELADWIVDSAGVMVGYGAVVFGLGARRKGTTARDPGDEGSGERSGGGS